MLLAAALIAAQASVPAAAQTNGEISFVASAGFDGYFKEGNWIPVRVELANDGSDAEVLIEVSPTSSGRTSVYSQSVFLASGARKKVTLYVYPTGATRSLAIRLNVQDQLSPQENLTLARLSSNDILVGVMAADPTPFNVIRTPLASGVINRVEIALLAPETLPDQPPALSNIDALVICDQDTGSMTAAQRQALQAWVASGGRLLVCGGPNWQRTTAGLAGLLPMEVAGTARVAGLDSVGSYLSADPGPPGEVIVAVGSLAPDSETVIEQDGLPFALARRFGVGQVVFLAADPTLAPLSAWSATQLLYRALLLEGPYAQVGRWGAQEDSAAQAASLFPNLTLPPIGAVCGFLVVYTFAIGPLHYLVLRRAKRRELAWITIPGLVVVFSAAAFGIGSLSRGGRAVVNRLAVVHVSVGADRAQVKGVLGIFSPRRSKLEFEFAPGLLARPLAGGYSLTDGDWQFHQTAGGPGETEMQFDVASVRGLVFEGDIAAPEFIHSLSAEVAGLSLQVGGQVVSRDLRLTDAALLTPYGVVPLGDLERGEPRQIRGLFPLSGFPAAADFGMMSALGAAAEPYYGSSGSNELGAVQRGALLEAMGLGYGVTIPGTYLVGWSEQAPLQPELQGASDTDDLTLYFVELGMAVGPGAPSTSEANWPQMTAPPTPTPAFLLLEPGDFAWEVLEADPGSPAPSPYTVQVIQGTTTLRFIPAIPVSFRSVQSLTLDLRGSSEGVAPAEFVRLWNHTSQAWEIIPSLGWGDHPIYPPGDYVGPDGEIRLRFENSEEGVAIVVSMSLFSLVLEP